MTSDGIMKEVEAGVPSREDVNKSDSDGTRAVLGEDLQRGVAPPFGSQSQDKVKSTDVSTQVVVEDMLDIDMHLKKLCKNLTNVINSYSSMIPIFRDALEQNWITDDHSGSPRVAGPNGNVTEGAEEEMRQNFMYLEILDMLDRIRWINSAMETIKTPEVQLKKSKRQCDCKTAEDEDHCEKCRWRRKQSSQAAGERTSHTEISSVTASVRDPAKMMVRPEEEVEEKKTDESHQSSVENLMKEKDGLEDRIAPCSIETTEEIYQEDNRQEVEETACSSPSCVMSQNKGEFQDEIEEQAEGKLEFETEEASDWQDNDEEVGKNKSKEVEFDTVENLQKLYGDELEVNIKGPIDEESDEEGENKQQEFKVFNEGENEAEPWEDVKDDVQEKIEDTGEGEIHSEENGQFESETADKMMDEIIKDFEIKDTEEGRAEAENDIETESEIQDEVKEDLENKAKDETRPEEEMKIKSEDEEIEDLENKAKDETRPEEEMKIKSEDEEIEDLENKDAEEARTEAEDEIEIWTKIHVKLRLKENLEIKGEDETRIEEETEIKSEVEGIEDEVIQDLETKDAEEGRAEVKDDIETGSDIQEEVKENFETKDAEEGRAEVKDEIETGSDIQEEVKENFETKDADEGRAEVKDEEGTAAAEDEIETGSDIQGKENQENKSDDERNVAAEGEITSEVEDKFQDDVKEKCETETEAKDVSVYEGETQKVKDDIEMKFDEENEVDEETEVKSEIEDKIQNEVNEMLEYIHEVGKKVKSNLTVVVEDSGELEIDDDARQVANGASEIKLGISGHSVQGGEFEENKEEKKCKVEDDVEVEGEVRSEVEEEVDVEVKMKNQEEDSIPVKCDADSKVSLKSEIEKEIELIDKEKCEDESEAEAEIKGKGEEECEDMPGYKGEVDRESKIDDEAEVYIKSEEEKFKGESEYETEDEGRVKHMIEGNGEGEDEGNKELDQVALSNEKYAEQYIEMPWSETGTESPSDIEEKDKEREGDTKGEKESPASSTQRQESKDSNVLKDVSLEVLDETSTGKGDGIDTQPSGSWSNSPREILPHEREDADTDVPKGFPRRVSETPSDQRGDQYTVVSQSFQDETLTRMRYDSNIEESQTFPRKSETTLDQRESIVEASRHRKEHEGTEASQQSPRQSVGETCILDTEEHVCGRIEMSNSLSSFRRQIESQVLKELTSSLEEPTSEPEHSTVQTSSTIPSSCDQIDPSEYNREQQYGVKLPSVHGGKGKKTMPKARPSAARTLLGDTSHLYIDEIRELVRNLGYSHQFILALTGSRLHRNEPKNTLRVTHLYKSPSPRKREDPIYPKVAVNPWKRTLMQLKQNQLPLESQYPHEPTSTYIRKKTPPKIVSRGLLPPLRQGQYLIQQCVDNCKCRNSKAECSHLANQCSNWNPEHLEISCDDLVQNILMYQIPEVRRLQDNFLFLYNSASSENTANPQKNRKTKSQRRTISPKLPPFKN